MIDPYGVAYGPYTIDPYPKTIGVYIGVYAKPDRPYIDPYPKSIDPIGKESLCTLVPLCRGTGISRTNPL